MTANTMPTFTFNRGGDAAEEADKAAQGPRTSTRADFFSLKDDGDSMVIRPLTDYSDWIYVAQHSFMPTKPAPEDAERWPESMMAICRHDTAFNGHYPDCYLCDNKIKNRFGKHVTPAIRLWALAVEREVVYGDGSEALGGPAHKGTVVGVRDKTDEIEETDEAGEPTGTTLRFPRILVINQPRKGFFAHLQGLYGLFGTVCDRDFTVTRVGQGTETDYRFKAIDPVEGLKPGTEAWEKYTSALAEREISLEQMIAHRASDAYYARWFDPALSVDEDGNVTATGRESAPASGGYSDDLKQRIRQMGSSLGS